MRDDKIRDLNEILFIQETIKKDTKKVKKEIELLEKTLNNRVKEKTREQLLFELHRERFKLEHLEEAELQADVAYDELISQIDVIGTAKGAAKVEACMVEISRLRKKTREKILKVCNKHVVNYKLIRKLL